MVTVRVGGEHDEGGERDVLVHVFSVSLRAPPSTRSPVCGGVHRIASLWRPLVVHLVADLVPRIEGRAASGERRAVSGTRCAAGGDGW